MGTIWAFAAGAIFGLGLIVGGMIDPAKVMGFLDFTGAWDPSLMFVMMGAIAVHFVMFRLVKRRPSPLFDTKFHLPTRKDIDAPLVVGAALFGAGWGLAGFCPGPGLVSLGSGATTALVFVGAMTAGMLIQHATAKKTPTTASATPTTPPEPIGVAEPGQAT